MSDNSVFDTIRGLPVHVLVLHITIVLVPLMSVVTAVVAWMPRRRVRTALVVVLADVVTLGVVLVTRQSGLALKRRLPPTPAIQHHAQLGLALVWYVVALLAAAVLVLITTRSAAARSDAAGADDADETGGWADEPGDRLEGRRRIRAGAGGRGHSLVTVATGVLVTVVAAGTLVWVVRVGEAGATAVWRQIVISTNQNVGR